MWPLDSFTQELPDSWNTAEVDEWKKRAAQLLKSYYLGFAGGQWDEYELPQDHQLLLAKICYSLYGAPTETEQSDELAQGYKQEQQDSAQKLANKILEINKDINAEKLLLSIIFVACKQGEAEFVLPVFSIFAGEKPEDPQASRVYVDHYERIYKGWQDWKENNTLPMLKYAYPRHGFFTCSTDCQYEFDPNLEPNLEFGNSPQCNTSSRILRSADGVSALGILTCAGIAVTSIATGGVAPGLMLSTAYVGGIFGLYGGVRAGQRLLDKGYHGESLRDLESITLYFSIIATPLHLGTTFINGALVRGATANGRIFSHSMRMFATVLNCTALGVDAVLVGCGLANLIEKARADQLTTLDVVQFSMSVFFFTNTLIRPQTARAIIEQAQDAHISQYSETMSDETARATFDKFVQDNLNKGTIRDKSNIIRHINKIESPEAFFGNTVSNSEQVRLGGQSGKSVLVKGADGETVRINTRDKQPIIGKANQPIPKLKVPTTATKASKKAVLVKRDLAKEAVEAVGVDGERMYQSFSEADQSRLNSALNTMGEMTQQYGMLVLRSAWKIAKEMQFETSNGQKVTLVELVTTYVKKRINDHHTESLNRIYLNPADFAAELERDVRVANSIAKLGDLPRFANPLKVVHHYRKHGHEFPQRIWNPATHTLEVYLNSKPELLQAAELVEIQQFDNGASAKYYTMVDEHMEQPAVLVELPEECDELSSFVQISGGPSSSVSFSAVPNCELLAEYIQHFPARIEEMTGYRLDTEQTLRIFITLEDGTTRYSWVELQTRWNTLQPPKM